MSNYFNNIVSFIEGDKAQKLSTKEVTLLIDTHAGHLPAYGSTYKDGLETYCGLIDEDGVKAISVTVNLPEVLAKLNRWNVRRGDVVEVLDCIAVSFQDAYGNSVVPYTHTRLGATLEVGSDKLVIWTECKHNPNDSWSGKGSLDGYLRIS